MDAIDWPGIRAAAVTQGIRAAARSAAINLPPIEQERFVFRVLKRASREKWEEARLAAKPAQHANSKPQSSKVLNGSEAAQNGLLEQKQATRSNLAKYAVDASSKAAKSKGNLAIAGQVRQVAAILPAVWPEEQGPAISVQLLNANGSME